ncbi:MAG: sigma factor-like helix-turn-helix DNA-binding protein [Ilumatobacteraceae bacterium]
MTEPIRGLRRVPLVQAAELITTTEASVSFEAFYRGERARIGRALAVTLRDRELAIDAVDEAMARAYARWARVGTLDNPGGWVYRVGLNWSRSFLRRATRPAPLWVTRPVGAPPDASGDPAVDAALGQLSVDQRSVVVCRLLLGLSERETATALNLRPGTVKSRLHRATQRLQTLLHTEDEQR